MSIGSISRRSTRWKIICGTAAAWCFSSAIARGADFMNTPAVSRRQGPFPVPLVGPTELLVDRTEPVADLTVE